MKRETTEWSQFYWFDTNCNNLPRILLVGDSIVAATRQSVADHLRGKAVVAAFSTSKIVGDPAFYRELALALADYPVDLIYFNNGLHGLDHSDEFYRNALNDLVSLLQQSNRAVLAWRSSTPVTIEGKSAHLDPVLNSVVIRRNEIAEEIMRNRDIPVDDLYLAVMNHPEFRKDDGVHYNRQGNEFIGRHCSKFLEGLLKKSDQAFFLISGRYQCRK